MGNNKFSQLKTNILRMKSFVYAAIVAVVSAEEPADDNAYYVTHHATVIPTVTTHTVGHYYDDNEVKKEDSNAKDDDNYLARHRYDALGRHYRSDYYYGDKQDNKAEGEEDNY